MLKALSAGCACGQGPHLGNQVWRQEVERAATGGTHSSAACQSVSNRSWPDPGVFKLRLM
eukprot:15192589-Alexandrium_andersonii.AAC.1